MNMKRFDRKSLILTIAGIVVAAVALALAYGYARNLEISSYPATEMKGYTSPANAFARRVAYKDKEYIYKSDITTILFMGIDKTGAPVEENLLYKYISGGQADFLMLFVIDHDERKISRLMIDRDTIVDITIVGMLGNIMGTRLDRIALSHGYGVGGQQSAEFTVEAVSKWLMGIGVDYYVAMNLDGIPLLNDSVGGVTVTLNEDLTQFEPTFEKGATVTLHGEQTVWFVRSRMTIGEGTNEARMVRQRIYLNALADNIGDKIHADVNWIDKLFDALKDALVSNMSRGRMVNEAYKAMTYEAGPLYTLPGEHTLEADGFVAFWPDEEALTQWVLDTFTEEAQVSAK
ncbi:MAG: LCP family protein [Oscillospiraceae bacterium]|jgi:LCP family protein required for cell wall assembly|nr:LCP family protein [Oscillospiraceae bacterium]